MIVRMNARPQQPADHSAEPSAAYVRDVVLAGEPRFGAWNVVGPVARGRQALVYRASAPTGHAEVAIKIYRRKFHPRRLESIYKHHESRRRALTPFSDLAIPEAHAYLPDHNCIVMDWIAEPRLTILLIKPLVGPSRQVLLESAGKWLRAFHGDQQTPRQFDASAALDPLHLLVRKAESEHGQGYLGPGFARFMDLLANTVSRANDSEVPVAGLHGDYMPHNLFFGAGRMIGIDFADERMGFVTSDICQFLASLHHRALIARARGNAGTLGLVRDDAQAILRGYLRPGETLAPSAMRWSQLLYILRRWASTAGREHAGAVDYVLRRHRAVCLAFMAEAVAAELMRP